jgi:ketosteroid isomerase-like protein
MSVRETTDKIDPERVLERIRQAFAERDPKAWMDLYADDARVAPTSVVVSNMGRVLSLPGLPVELNG